MALAALPVAVPLLAAAALTAVGMRAGRRMAVASALLAALAVTVLSATLLARAAGGVSVHWFGGWEPRHGLAIGIDFAVDPFGAGLATLVGILVVAATVVMSRYREADSPHFEVLLLLFCAGMAGLCLSGDVFDMFVFFELMSVAAFALAGYLIEEGEAVEGSLNFAITNTIGSFLILTGIALVYGRTGALNLAQVAHGLAARPPDGLVAIAFALLVCGFLVKAAIVPFHFWLADAYAVAPTPVCLVFAGAMSELGIYAVGRIWFDGFTEALAAHAGSLRLVLVIAGCLTAVIGALMAFLQDHLKRMLAFATIAYAGVFLIGLATLSADGVAGSALYIVADGFGKASLFVAVAILQHRRAHVSELALTGRGRALPFTGAVVLLGALSFAAVPPFGTFLGKSLIEDALGATGYGWVTAVLLVASALTAAAVVRAIGRVFCGLGQAKFPGEPVRAEAQPA